MCNPNTKYKTPHQKKNPKKKNNKRPMGHIAPLYVKYFVPNFGNKTGHVVLKGKIFKSHHL